MFTVTCKHSTSRPPPPRSFLSPLLQWTVTSSFWQPCDDVARGLMRTDYLGDRLWSVPVRSRQSRFFSVRCERSRLGSSFFFITLC